MTPPPDLDRLLADVREEASSEDPLDLLAAATTTRDTLTDAAEAVLDHFVEVARDTGCSWTEIGDALGVSKQAAQRRASTAQSRLLRRLFARLRDPGMLRRFTSETRDSIVAARDRQPPTSDTTTWARSTCCSACWLARQRGRDDPEARRA